jgi:DNA-binding winged helix-turn-helix (wHTH) protein
MRLSGDSTSIGSHDRPADPCPVVSMGESQEASVPERVLLSSGRYIYFGPFRVDQQRQEVSRDGVRIKLQGKAYQTLLALLEKSGEVVTREELRMRLWPDTHVNYDANVNTAVNKLRGVLADSSDKPAYIETIPKKGYLFLVQPEVSGMPGNRQFRNQEPSESAEVTSQTMAVSGFSKSDLWMVLGAVGLILAGMILGAGIMSLWINHASRLPCAAAGFNLNHGRSPSSSFTAPSIKLLSLDQQAKSRDLHGAGRSPFPISIEFHAVFFLKEDEARYGGVGNRGSLQNLEVSSERFQSVRINKSA